MTVPLLQNMTVVKVQQVESRPTKSKKSGSGVVRRSSGKTSNTTSNTSSSPRKQDKFTTSFIEESMAIMNGLESMLSSVEQNQPRGTRASVRNILRRVAKLCEISGLPDSDYHAIHKVVNFMYIEPDDFQNFDDD